MSLRLGGLIALILIVGTPAAYLLTTRSFRGKALVVTLVTLTKMRSTPSVLPSASDFVREVLDFL